MMLTLLSIDPALGRLGYDSLSDQARMEIFVDGLTEETKKHFQDPNGGFLDISEWSGVSVSDEGEVLIVSFSKLDCHFNIAGSLNFRFLPPRTSSFRAWNQKLYGTIEASDLPQNLFGLSLPENGFFGSFDFQNLPKPLQYLDLQRNAFTGKCDLTKLPQGLKRLLLASNEFSGSVRLDALPSGLEHLELQQNDFSGEICVSKLPDTLMHIFLDENEFTGGFILEKFPEGLLQIRASDNKLSGVAVVSKDRYMRVALGGNAIDRVIDEEGRKHEREEEMLNLYNNLV